MSFNLFTIEQFENFLYDKLGLEAANFINLQCKYPVAGVNLDCKAWEITYAHRDWDTASIQWNYKLSEGYSPRGNRITGVLELVTYIKNTMRKLETVQSSDSIEIIHSFNTGLDSQKSGPSLPNSVLRAVGSIFSTVDNQGNMQYGYVHSYTIGKNEDILVNIKWLNTEIIQQAVQDRPIDSIILDRAIDRYYRKA